MFKLVALLLIIDVTISAGFHLEKDATFDKRQATDTPVTIKQIPAKPSQPPKVPSSTDVEDPPRPRKTPQPPRRLYADDDEEEPPRPRKTTPVDTDTERSSYSIGSSISNFWGGMFGWWRSAADQGLRNMESFVDGVMGRKRVQPAEDQLSVNKGFLGGIMNMFGGK